MNLLLTSLYCWHLTSRPSATTPMPRNGNIGNKNAQLDSPGPGEMLELGLE